MGETLGKEVRVGRRFSVRAKGGFSSGPALAGGGTHLMGYPPGQQINLALWGYWTSMTSFPTTFNTSKEPKLPFASRFALLFLHELRFPTYGLG